MNTNSCYKRLEESAINGEDEVKAYLYGDTMEFVMNSFESNVRAIKISKDKYNLVDTSTGEIIETKDYRHSESRKDNLGNVRQSLRKLSRLINQNFDGSDNELWVTLTYAKNERDTKVVYKDFKNFIAKLRRSTGSKLDYIYVIEPQERGAWHCHVLLKDFSSEHLFIEKEEIHRCWGQGFVDVKKLDESDNVAAYLTAYLTNLEYDEEDENGNSVKAIKKGARLHLYPPGMNIFRSSRGIQKPLEVRTQKDFFNLENHELKFASELEFDNGYVCKEIYREKKGS